MSFSQTINFYKGQASFRNVSIESLADLDLQVADCKEQLLSLKERIKMFAAAHPKDIVDSEEDLMSGISDRVDNCFAEYNDTLRKLHTLLFIKSTVDEYIYVGEMTPESAFNTAVVDMYADIRNC